MVSAEGDMYVSVNSAGINNAYYWDYLQASNQEDLNINGICNLSQMDLIF